MLYQSTTGSNYLKSKAGITSGLALVAKVNNLSAPKCFLNVFINSTKYPLSLLVGTIPSPQLAVPGGHGYSKSISNLKLNLNNPSKISLY